MFDKIIGDARGDATRGFFSPLPYKGEDSGEGSTSFSPHPNLLPHREKGFILLVFLSIFLSSFLHAATVKGMRYVMGTTLRVEIRGDQEPVLKQTLENVFAEVKKLDKLLSSYDERSEISRLGQEAPQWVKVSPQTLRIFILSYEWAKRTDGAFEPTIWPLVKLWGFDTRRLHKPSAAELQHVLPLLNYHVMQVDLGASRARLTKPGSAVDLGAIGKGYALEEARRHLGNASGITSAILDFGGEILFWSQGDPALLWKVLIRDPSSEEGKVSTIGEFKMAHPGAVSTSSNGERYLIAADPKSKMRYGHILNPKTGMPIDHVESVTVIANDATSADVLSTAVFVMGKDRGLALIDSLVDTGAIIFYRDENGARRWVASKSWSQLAKDFKVYS